MSKQANPTVIGGFVVGAVALLAVGVALFGGSELLAKRFHYVAYFEEQTKGLRVGSNVVLNGVRIGYVSEIALLIDESEYATLTRVTLEILPEAYIPISNGKRISDDLREVIEHDDLVHKAGLRAQLEAVTDSDGCGIEKIAMSELRQACSSSPNSALRALRSFSRPRWS